MGGYFLMKPSGQLRSHQGLKAACALASTTLGGESEGISVTVKAAASLLQASTEAVCSVLLIVTVPFLPAEHTSVLVQPERQ